MEWERVHIQQAEDIWRAVQVVAGDFQGINHYFAPDGIPDAVYSVKQNGFIRIASNYNSSADTWSYEYVDDSVPDAVGLATGDVDGDGYLDIIGTSFVNYIDDYPDPPDPSNDGFLAWWKRTSSGWDRTIIARGLMISESGKYCEMPLNADTSDIDQDGDIDIVATIHGNWTNPDESSSGLYWFENTSVSGDGSTWEAHVIDTGINRPYAVRVGNLDGDINLIPDIAITTTDLPLAIDDGIYDSENEGVYVYYGEGGGDFSARDQIYWYDPDDPPVYYWVSPRSIKVADFDLNGYADLIVAFTNKQNPTLYENHHGVAVLRSVPIVPGSVTWSREPITPAYMTPRDLFPVDFDGDNDMDIFVTSLWGNEVSWFENLGVGNGWDQHYVGPCLLAKGINMADYDSGGRLEVVAASYSQLWSNPTPPPLSGRTIQMYKYTEEVPTAVLTNTFSLTIPSTVELNSDLEYSYSFTLEDTSTVQLFARYDVYIPDERFITQTTLDTLGYLPATYAGEGSIAIPDSNFTSGSECLLYLTIGRIVTTDADPPVELYHGVKVICDTFSVVNPINYTDVSNNSHELPATFGIKSIVPNPFNPTTTCTITIPQAANLSVDVFNITGQQIASLCNGRVLPGSHQYLFDGTGVASGVYFLRAAVPGHLNEIRKLVLLR